ncbi:MAG: dockerin type I domain-containing protein [Acutalibacteraceae bacterium]
MKNMKKVATVLLALLLVMSTMSLGAFAADETGTIGITITADKTKNLYPGDIVTFTINIKNDFNYVCMRWPVMYTAKVFEPVIANDGNGDADYCNVSGYGSLSGVDSILESGELPSTSEAFGGTYNKTNYKGILIQWTGGTSSSGIAYYHEENGSDCIQFQLRVKDAPTATSATVIIPTTTQCKGFFYYQAITDPADISTLYKMSSTTCTVTSTGATLSVFKEAAGIKAKAGTDIVIDEDGYIYGFTEVVRDFDTLNASTISSWITTAGGATYTFDTNASGNYSTGATLHVYDADGNSVADYQVVIFGDINGDGIINAMDSANLIIGYLNLAEWSEDYDPKANAMYFACDANADGAVENVDYGPLEVCIHGDGYINQTYDASNPLIYFE